MIINPLEKRGRDGKEEGGRWGGGGHNIKEPLYTV